MSAKAQEIIINKQPVELCKLLKIANLVSGGGEAKIVITQGYVILNGVVEYQKRKKINHGDIIEFNGDTLAVVYSSKGQTIPTTSSVKNNETYSTKTSANKIQPNQPNSTTDIQDKTHESVKLSKKRKAIIF